MGTSWDELRASRYRRLAAIEKDKAVADLLNGLAREAELGILFTVDRVRRPWQLLNATQPANRAQRSASPNPQNADAFSW